MSTGILVRDIVSAPGLTFERMLRTEASKLWSLRSPRWIAIAMVLGPLVLGSARASVAPSASLGALRSGAAAGFESVAIGVLPVAFLAAVLGLVAMGSEYTGEVISGTFMVSPRRRLFVVAKTIPVLIASFVAALIGLTGAGIVATVILDSRGYDAIFSAELLGIVGCGALAAALLGILGVASAALTRSLVVAAISLAAVIVLAPTTIGILGGAALARLTDLLPATAIQALVTRAPAIPFTVEGAPVSTLTSGGGFLVLIGWVSCSLALALVLIQRRSVTSVRARRRRGRSALPPQSTLTTGLRVVNVLRSEILKLATLPAAWWLLGVSSGATVLIAILTASSIRPQDLLLGPLLPGDVALITADTQSQVIASGLGLAQMLLTFFGAIAVTIEFSSGNIRPTLLAVPRRAVLLLCKTGVVTAAATVFSLVAGLLAAALSTPILNRQGFAAQLFSPIVLETVVRCTVACTLITIIGCAAGVLLRAPVAAISVLVAVFILSHTALGPLQVATQGTPLVWLANLDELFPSAVVAVQTIPPKSSWPQYLSGSILQFDPNQAMVVIAGWAILGGVAALLVFRRRSV